MPPMEMYQAEVGSEIGGMMNAHIMKPIYMKKLNSTVQDVITEGAGVPEEGENGDHGCHK